MFPGVLRRIALNETTGQGSRSASGGSTTPLWLEMLTSRDIGGSHSNFLDTLDRASVVRDGQAQHVAHSVRVMFQDEGVTESVTAPLNKATSAKALVGGLKSA